MLFLALFLLFFSFSALVKWKCAVLRAGDLERAFSTASFFKAAVHTELPCLPGTVVRKTAVHEAAWYTWCLNQCCGWFLLRLCGSPTLMLLHIFRAISNGITCDVSVLPPEWRTEGSNGTVLVISPRYLAVRVADRRFVLPHQHPSSQHVLSHQHL